MSLRARERCLTRLAVVLTQTQANHYLDPFVCAFMSVARNMRPKLYKGLITGKLSPRELMATVMNLPRVRAFADSRVTTVIEASLIAGDIDRVRGEETQRALRELAEREPTTKDTIRARELVDMLRHVSGRSFRDFSTSYVANKIDLASRVGDDR